MEAIPAQYFIVKEQFSGEEFEFFTGRKEKNNLNYIGYIGMFELVRLHLEPGDLGTCSHYQSHLQFDFKIIHV